MALITDYDTLKTAVGDYLARSDLSGFIPNFLQNGENKLYRHLRIRAMETSLSGTIGSGVLAVPSDYLELKFANVTTSPYVSLERTTPEFIYARYPVRSGAEIPKYIARQGDNFIFGPYPGDYSISGIYYKRLTSLSSVSTTNWFTTYAPEVLLYAALLEAQPFLMNDKRIPVWQAALAEAIDTVNMAERGENHSGSTLAVQAG
jgi:hypothetical protein